MQRLSRRYLWEKRRELNQTDAALIQSLLESRRCMHRIAAEGMSYIYCGKPSTHYAAGGRILLCESHREQ